MPPYGLEAKDFQKYEDTFSSELKDPDEKELANGDSIQLVGAAGKEVKGVDFQYRGKHVCYEVFEAMDAKRNKPYQNSLIYTEVEFARGSPSFTQDVGFKAGSCHDGTLAPTLPVLSLSYSV